MKRDRDMHIVGGVLGASIGGRFGWIGAGVGAFVGIVASEFIQVPKQRSARVNLDRRPTSKSTSRPTPVQKTPVDDGKYNICSKCNTANEETLLLCEFCGERMPVKRD